MSAPVHEAANGAELAFEIPGEPVPKGRARAFLVKGTRRIRTFTPAETRSYETRVRVCAAAAVNLARWTATKAERFEVEIRVYRTHEGAGGDLSNYVKAVEDGANGIAFPDDRYVRRLVASLHVDVARPRVEVRITRMQ